MYKPPSPQAFGPAVNRISDVMAHTTRYASSGVIRLAEDAEVTPSAVSKIINGKRNPSSLMVARIAAALEQALGIHIDPRDLVAENGRFPTRFACDLAGCSGCLPERSHDEFGNLKPAFEGIRPGEWVTSRYPKGYERNRKEANA